MTDENTPPPAPAAPTYRIDVVDEATGTTIHAVQGVTGTQLQALMRLVSKVSTAAQEFGAIRNSIERIFGRRG